MCHSCIHLCPEGNFEIGFKFRWSKRKLRTILWVSKGKLGTKIQIITFILGLKSESQIKSYIIYNPERNLAVWQRNQGSHPGSSHGMPRRKHVQSLRGQTNFKVTNHQPKASANYRWLHSLENIATTRRRMPRERRGAESSVVSMETLYYKII